MVQRCTNPNRNNYHLYGGRGISHDPRWASFACFLEDMGERPKGTSLERKESELGYAKSNCVWATSKQQSQNRRNNKLSSASVADILTRQDSISKAAAKHSVSTTTIKQVRKGATWNK